MLPFDLQKNSVITSYITILTLMSVCPCAMWCLCVTLLKYPIPAVVSQNVTYKSCLVGVKSEEYSFRVTLKHLGSMLGEV